MTEKVDTQQDRFCAYGRDPAVAPTRNVCYGIKWQGHGGDGELCRKHKYLGGTREEVWAAAMKAAREEVIEDLLSALIKQAEAEAAEAEAGPDDYQTTPAASLRAVAASIRRTHGD